MYWSRTGNPLELLMWLAMSGLWWAGGWMLVTHAFHLRARERLLAGLASGLLLFIVLSNLLAHILPLTAAFWGASLLILGAGVFSARNTPITTWFQREDMQAWPQLLVFAGLLALFAMINRGLAIFDDYYNLPIVSVMAAGDVPPHSHLDSATMLFYHYGLHLFAASLVRVASFFPWSAFDLAKAICMALTPVITWLWVRKVTGSRTAGLLAGFLVLFAGGARWLLLFFPETTLLRLGSGLRLLGATAASGLDLNAVMSNPFKIEGGGPFPFPAALMNGIFTPLLLALGSSSALPYMTLPLLLLLARRQWNALTGVLYGLILASLALSFEHMFGIFWAGLLLAAGVGFWVRRNTRQLFSWIWVLAPSLLLALFAGGVITEIVRGIMSPTASAANSGISGFDGFHFNWPPAIISAHLGPLSLVKPNQLLIALFEMGPALLLAPWVLVYSIKQARRGNWTYAALSLGAAISFLAALFVSYGAERDTSRLSGTALFIWMLLGFPLAWFAWRRAGAGLRTVLAAGYGMSVLAGAAVFMILLMAIPHPQFTYFVQDVDALMSKNYWDQLQPGAQVIDPIPYRAVTLFGRSAGHVSPDPYRAFPEWEALFNSPDPASMARAGYSYLYMDKTMWQNLTPPQKEAFQNPCVKLLAEKITDDRDFRRILDIRKCGK